MRHTQFPADQDSFLSAQRFFINPVDCHAQETSVVAGPAVCSCGHITDLTENVDQVSLSRFTYCFKIPHYFSPRGKSELRVQVRQELCKEF